MGNRHDYICSGYNRLYNHKVEGNMNGILNIPPTLPPSTFPVLPDGRPYRCEGPHPGRGGVNAQFPRPTRAPGLAQSSTRARARARRRQICPDCA